MSWKGKERRILAQFLSYKRKTENLYGKNSIVPNWHHSAEYNFSIDDIKTEEIIENVLLPLKDPKIEARFLKMYKKLEMPEEVDYEIVSYFPISFEYLRGLCGYSRQGFINSISIGEEWMTTGGKTDSDFYQTRDKRFVAKGIKDVEFFMFKEFAHSYFEYTITAEIYQKNTCLSKIFGLFEIKINKKEKEYFIIMENLFYGLDSKKCKVFDLKGSKKNRFSKTKVVGQTLLDTNYLLERNGDPLCFLPPSGFDFFNAMENDSIFLKKQQVVDYSLLLIVDEHKKMIRIGIIDYLRKYDLYKRLEELIKRTRYFGENPTIVKPANYAERFMKAISRYFVQLKENEF